MALVTGAMNVAGGPRSPAQKGSKCLRSGQLLQLAMAEGGGTPLQQQVISLWRRKDDVNPSKSFVRLSKKYLKGIEATATANMARYDNLTPRFLAGDFNGTIHGTLNPVVSAKYAMGEGCTGASG